jgi:hypothetical protein
MKKDTSINQWSEVRNTDTDNVLKIANSRGKRPVMRDLEKARGIISNLLVEINPCEAKDKLKDIDNTLWAIIHEKQNS